MSRKRAWLVWGLIVVATLITLVSSLTVWSKRQLLSTDNWTNSSAKLLRNDDIRAAVSAKLVEVAFNQTNATAQLEKYLPKQAQGAAPAIAAGIQVAANRAANTLLATPRAQQLWEQANRTAHQHLVAVLEKKNVGRVSADTGTISLQLGPLAQRLDQRLGLRARLGQSGSPSGEIVLIKSKDLKTAQDAVRILNALTVFLAIVALGLYALAIYLARGRRRKFLEVSGTSLIFVGLLVLIIRRIVGGALIDSIVNTEANRPAVRAVWFIETDLLRDIAIALLLYGGLMVLAGFFGGPSRPATASRRQLAPAFRRHLAAVYAVTALVFLLFIAWGPTTATRRLWGVVLLAALTVLAIEAWRRQTLREFPETPAVVLPTSPPPDDKSDSSLETLERLARLRSEGVLSEAEFQQQKAALLGT
jgi:Short C-terminal domain